MNARLQGLFREVLKGGGVKFTIGKGDEEMCINCRHFIS